MRMIVASMLFAGFTWASELEAPSLGWFWDAPSKGLRRLAGLPGSIRNEDGVRIGDEAIAAWIAPDASHAVIALSDGRLQRKELRSGGSIHLEAELPERVLFSVDGKRTGLWWPENHRFAFWGEPPVVLDAKAIAIPNQGEPLVLEKDGLLRTLGGSWIGNYGAEANLGLSGGNAVVAIEGGFVLLEQTNLAWKETRRISAEGVPVVSEIVLDGHDSVLLLSTDGTLSRWGLLNGSREQLAVKGVSHIHSMPQKGFFWLEGESPSVLYSPSTGQKVYQLPAAEVNQ